MNYLLDSYPYGRAYNNVAGTKRGNGYDASERINFYSIFGTCIRTSESPYISSQTSFSFVGNRYLNGPSRFKRFIIRGEQG